MQPQPCSPSDCWQAPVSLGQGPAVPCISISTLKSTRVGCRWVDAILGSNPVQELELQRTLETACMGSVPFVEAASIPKMLDQHLQCQSPGWGGQFSSRRRLPAEKGSMSPWAQSSNQHARVWELPPLE